MYDRTASQVPQTQQRRSNELIDSMSVNGKRLHEISERLNGVLVRLAGPAPTPNASNGKDILASVPSGLAQQIAQQNSSHASLIDQCERLLGQIEEFV